MPQLYTNNARALLTAGIDAVATSFTIESAKADLFPTANTGTGAVPSTNNWFKATLQNASGAIEIVYVRTRASGSAVMSNVLRAQEGTTAIAFASGSVVGLRVTAADMQNSANVAAANNNFTGANTFSGSTTVSGAVSFSNTASFTGNATFSNTITGSISGNAGTVTNGVYTTGEQTVAGAKIYTSPGYYQNGLHLTRGGVTADPYAPLSVTRGTTGNNAYLSFTRAGAVAWQIGVSTSDAIIIGSGTSGVDGALTGIGFTFDTGANLSIGGNFSAGGAITAAGNITANSDERLKTDWSPLPADFIERLAEVKHGTYTRIDTGERQAGSSAQDWQRLLPEVVKFGADDDKTLSLAYGNAALVSVIHLAREVIALRKELDELKGA